MAIDRTLSLLVKFGALDRLTGPMKAIGRGSRDAGAAIGATRRELANLERSQARIAKLRALETRLQGQGAALRDAREKVARLAVEIGRAEQPTKDLQQELSRAQRELAKLETSTDGEGAALVALRSKLSAAGIDLSRLGDEERRLGRDIDGANGKLKQQQAELARTREARERFEKTRTLGENVRGAGYGAVGAGVAIGAPIVATVDPYRDYQSGLTDIAQKADLTRAQAEKLGQTLIELGPKVAQLPENLRAGVDDLLGKGLDVGRASAIIAPIGKAATAYKAEMADLTSATYAGIDNLKVPFSEVGRQLDIMAAAGKAGSFEMKDMATYFPMLTASAQSLGQKGVGAVADLAAALQIARKGTGDAGTAANNLQNLMAKINTKDTIKNFKEFGVDLPAELKKAAAAGKSPVEAIAELTNRALGGNMEKLSYLFGDMQVQSALRPLIANIDLYRKIRSDALAAQGTVERDFLFRSEDDAVRAAKANAQMAGAVNRAGSIISPVWTAMQAKLGNLAAKMTSFADRHPTIAKGALLVAGGFAALLVVCGTLAIAGGTLITTWAYFSRSLGMAMTVIRVVATAFRMLSLAMMANPVLLLAVGIGVAAYLIWKHWDWIKSIFSKAWTWLTSLNFKAIGLSLLQGLINGLNPLTLVKHIMALGSKAVVALKAVLGIKSPSRVFAAIGGYMTEGMALGIDRGAAGPLGRARMLARNVAAAGAISTAPIAAAAQPALKAQSVPRLAPGAAPGSAAMAPGGNTYHLHLNLPAQASQDAAGFARQVMAEIERIERGRARASYRDD